VLGVKAHKSRSDTGKGRFLDKDTNVAWWRILKLNGEVVGDIKVGKKVRGAWNTTPQKTREESATQHDNERHNPA
jgi:hypothetical protein